MVFRNREPESDLDKAQRLHSEAVREQRTHMANDDRRSSGLAPTHCGVQSAMNGHGDWECTRCGDVF